MARNSSSTTPDFAEFWAKYPVHKARKLAEQAWQRLTAGDRRAAIARAMHEAKKDDIIVLCGKGHETYQIIGHEKTHFDEKEIVEETFKLILK